MLSTGWQIYSLRIRTEFETRNCNRSRMLKDIHVEFSSRSSVTSPELRPLRDSENRHHPYVRSLLIRQLVFRTCAVGNVVIIGNLLVPRLGFSLGWAEFSLA